MLMKYQSDVASFTTLHDPISFLKGIRLSFFNKSFVMSRICHMSFYLSLYMDKMVFLHTLFTFFLNLIYDLIIEKSSSN